MTPETHQTEIDADNGSFSEWEKQQELEQIEQIELDQLCKEHPEYVERYLR